MVAAADCFPDAGDPFGTAPSLSLAVLLMHPGKTSAGTKSDLIYDFTDNQQQQSPMGLHHRLSWRWCSFLHFFSCRALFLEYLDMILHLGEMCSQRGAPD